MLSNSMYTAIGHTAVKPLGSLIVAAKVRRDALLDTPGWLRLAEATSNQIRSTDTAAATAYLPPAVTVSNMGCTLWQTGEAGRYQAELHEGLVIERVD